MPYGFLVLVPLVLGWIMREASVSQPPSYALPGQTGEMPGSYTCSQM